MPRTKTGELISAVQFLLSARQSAILLFNTRRGRVLVWTALLLIDRQSIDWNEMMIGLSVPGWDVQLQSFSQWYTKARPAIGDDGARRGGKDTQKTGIRKCYNGSVTFCKSTCHHSSTKEWPDDFNLQFALIWDDGADFLIDVRSRMRIALHGIAMLTCNVVDQYN